ncbi:ATP-binding cassette domain-containing protein [Mesorhizobium sp. IMUNJ 23232]|uniref:ATP-binding cassette domain-containing protein n=1 Tax=Mesorhizobium sp. IMUNJ 23232 TaxID=3376064 RepID=UPI0037B87E7B
MTAVATLDRATEAASAPAALIGLVHASKHFGGTIALREASFDLRGGEVLALLGENGAGKSTCVKLLAGVYQPTSGHVVLDGQPVLFNGPLDAQRAGIAVMHQHPGLFPDLSVAENVFMGHMPRAGAAGIDHAAMQQRTASLLATIGLDVDPGERLSRLRTSEQQLVEVARALSLDARVLIMDEPTAALSQREVARLFQVVETLKTRGVAMMFVGHRMDEIFHVADAIAVLRDGALVGVERANRLSRGEAIRMMVGRELSSLYPQADAVPGKTVLEIERLTRAGEFADISLSVRAGEIVGLGGLVGSGRTEIARALFGITQPDGGTIRIAGAAQRFTNAADAMAVGIAYVSEDRLGQSLVMDFSITENVALTQLDHATSRGLFSRTKVLDGVGRHLDRLKLRFQSFDQPVSTLSGGNQQKVVLAKWLATSPKLMILDEPTQGIDVQSKAEVHAMMADLAKGGMAILLISSEMPELLGMSDRIVVLREGRQTASFARGEATQEAVLRAATDIEVQPPSADAGGSSQAASPLAAERAGGGWTRSLFARRETGLLAAMAAVIVPVLFINPLVASPANLSALAMDASLLMIAALAQFLVLVTRNIDLSVASVIGLSAYGSALAMTADPSLGVAVGILAACGIGLACGLFNGAVIAFGGVPAIVATLGTMSVFRGLVSLWTGGRQISADQVPQAWLDLTGGRLAGVPVMILIALAIMAAASLLLNRSSTGRKLFALGSNPKGAELIGLPAKKLVLTAFGLAGTLAGLAGALWASRYATIDARVAYGYELAVIAAAVVGGVAIRGGSGTVLGVMLGGLTLLIIRNGLILARVDPLWLQGVYGLVILTAIGVDALVARRTAGSQGAMREAA